MKYKLRGCIIGLFWLFTLLLQGQVAWAETDLLNLSAYQEATAPLYGENVLVAQDEKTGAKWLTVGKEADILGRLKLSVNLSGDFEVVVKVKPHGLQSFFLTADEYRIKVGYNGENGSLGFQAGSDTGPGDDSNAWKRYSTNTLKLSVSGNIAKLYVNDVFSQKLTLKADLTYTQILYQGLDQESNLYEVTLGGSGGSAPSPLTGSQTDLLNLSSYQEDTTPLYGENVLIDQDEKTEMKWLTVGKEAGNLGRVKFPVNLSGDFEVTVKVKPHGLQSFFLTADEYRIKVGFNGEDGSLGLWAGSDAGHGDDSKAWMRYSTNTLKLSISGNVVKLYVNDVFSQKLTLKAGLTYTQWLYQGLDQNSKLYQATMGGSGGGGQPPVTGSQEPETDLLNLSSYQEATTPPYGENVLVGQDDQAEIKWLTVGKEEGSLGRVKFSVSLSGDFDVMVKVKPHGLQSFFLTADEYRIKVVFNGEDGSLGLQAGSDTGPGDGSSAWMRYSTNTLKLSVSGNVVKLYVNDVFSQKLTLKTSLTYTQLLYDGLDQNSKLYKLKVGKGVTVNPTPNPTPTTPTTPKPAKTCGCKKLPPPNATDATGKSVTTATVTYAGIIVNNQLPVVEVKQKLFDTVEVVGDLEVDPVDVGQHVDIFIYAAATFPGLSAVSYYMLGPGLTILPWDQHPASLVAFSSGTLGVFQTVQMYSGKFYYPGTLKVYFGYRLPNGIVITSSVPIDITIDP